MTDPDPSGGYSFFTVLTDKIAVTINGLVSVLSHALYDSAGRGDSDNNKNDLRSRRYVDSYSGYFADRGVG